MTVSRPEHPQKTGSFLTTPNTMMVAMILFVCVQLNEIHAQGRDFAWTKPDKCPCCGSTRLWWHGFVLACFDGFAQALWMRRLRCPDCCCVVRFKPKGFFRRMQASIKTIRSCLAKRLSTGRWVDDVSKSRQRHWLAALKRKCMAFFGSGMDLLAGFDQLVHSATIPVSRAI